MSLTCIHLDQLVSKGMPDPVAKLVLIERLNLTQVLSRIPLVNCGDIRLNSQDDDVDFLDSVAKLINIMGIEIIRCLEKVVS